MDPTELRACARLVEEWRGDRGVQSLIAELETQLAACDEPFVGSPLPERAVARRLPANIASAWVFVLRRNHRNPAHLHPNSTQYTTVIAGDGVGYFGAERNLLLPFDLARPDETIYAIPPGTPHSFDTGSEGLTVISFHTVAPELLVEIEVDSARARTYVGDARDSRRD